MKRLISLAFTVVIVSVVYTSSQISAQTAVAKPIPADVLKFTEKSCNACHGEQGGKMAQSALNLAGWDKYSPEKQAAKAKAMCDEVTKGKMPPKGYRNNNPGSVPGDEDIKMLCNWAESLKTANK